MYLSANKVWVDDPGIIVSRVMRSDVAGYGMCSPETDHDYPGHDLHVVSTLDLDTCIGLCSARVGCQGVTWTNNICKLKDRMADYVYKNTSMSVKFNCTQNKQQLRLFIAGK